MLKVAAQALSNLSAKTNISDDVGNHTLVILVPAVILQLSILDVGTPLLLLNSFVIVLQVDVTALMPVGTVKN